MHNTLKQKPYTREFDNLKCKLSWYGKSKILNARRGLLHPNQKNHTRYSVNLNYDVSGVKGLAKNDVIWPGEGAKIFAFSLTYYVDDPLVLAQLSLE